MPLSSYSFELIRVFAVLSILITVAILYLIIQANAQRKKAQTIVLLGTLLCSMALFEFLCVAIKQQRLFAEYKQTVIQTPLWLVIGIEAALIAAFFVHWLLLKKSKKIQITEESVREGLDDMPDGIAFSTPEGVPLLVNSTMRNIAHHAFRSEVVDMKELHDRFRRRALEPDCKVSQTDNAVFLTLPDKSVWNLRQNSLNIKGRAVNEIIANDITEQYHLSQELKSRNERLEEINAQLKAYSARLNTIIRESEILAAKIKVHDNIGQSLLALRAYLRQKSDDREQVMTLWRVTVAMLRGEAVETNSTDPIDALIAAGEAVGVTLRFDGELPAGEPYRELMTMAIHECLTNTVKHADGTELSIKTERNGNDVTVAFSNNGKPPSAPINETGGLKNLRDKAEACGAEMLIESMPCFNLTLTFKEEP